MDIMDIYGMSEWPGSPGRQRLREAEEEIETDSRRDHSRLDDVEAALRPPEEDARKLIGLMDIMQFTAESNEELLELHRGGIIRGPLEIAKMALRGSDQTFIAAVIRAEPEGFSNPHRHPYVITQLFRDPEWAGLNHLLTLLKGQEVHIFTGNGGRPRCCW